MKNKKITRNKIAKSTLKKSPRIKSKVKKTHHFGDHISDEKNITKFFKWLLKSLYNVLSNNGKSVSKPLIWLIFFNFVFYQIYWMVFLLKKNCSLFFVFLKTLNPFFSSRSMFCIHDHILANQAFLRVSALQFILNIFLVFLLVNALYFKFFRKRLLK